MEPTTERLPPTTEDDVLPTYEVATKRDPLTIIAPYVRREDLFSVSLVSRQWREAFMKEIWERPDALWELGDRPVLTKFLLFLRTISKTTTPRIHTRTLSLVTVQPSIYSTLPQKWLSTILLRFSDLRSFSLSSFSFFDHSSLIAVTPPAHTALQTLYATSCTNTTAPSLIHLLTLLPHLINLDLSSTNGASHASVLQVISTKLYNLRCLSLRELKLDDKALAPLIKALNTRLSKLDIGGNLLTDKTVDLLLDYSFSPPEYYTNTSTTPSEEVETPPPPPGFRDYAGGLTHLRIAANMLSNVGVQSLLKSTRLESLDVGAGLRGGVEGVVPALMIYAWKSLKTLRIDYRVVLQELKPGRLRGMKSIVLCAVPVTANTRLITALLGLLRELEYSGVEVLELEMDDGTSGGREDVGMYSSTSGTDSAAKSADFSFFSGDVGEGEGGSSWMGEGTVDVGGKEVDVIAEIGGFRKECKQKGTGWGGKVRIVRDLGGKGSIERGIGGERWGVLKEGV